MSAIRFSAAVTTGMAAVLLAAGVVHAAPVDGPPAVEPCSVVQKQGIDSRHCVQSAPETGQTGGDKHKGFSGYEVVIQDNIPVAANSVAQAVVACPAGKKAIGGGFLGFSPAVKPFRSFPSAPDYAAWVVAVENGGALPSAFDAYAICAKVGH
ncbi:hypothetical protein ACH4U6_26090 [Streptomyces netropsis]|uniref:hypothetical protein n=1 Tax=Streptomyces netropsis TaxID=55404 RepID=UPI0037B6413C